MIHAAGSCIRLEKCVAVEICVFIIKFVLSSNHCDVERYFKITDPFMIAAEKTGRALAKTTENITLWIVIALPKRHA